MKKVKYYHSKGTRTDSNGRTYWQAEMVGQFGRHEGKPVYMVRPEHTKYTRLLTEEQFDYEKND